MAGLDITAVASANQFIRTNLPGGGRIDWIDATYSAVANGDGQTAQTRAASVDVGGDH